MPYKCVHCLKSYNDGAHEVLNGCSHCGRRFFFYIKQEKLSSLEREGDDGLELSKEEKEKIEEDVRDIAGIEDDETPVFLEMESIKVIKHGKYLLDLTKLFSDKPKVYQLEDGKYIVDLTGLIKFSEKNKIDI